MPEQNKLIKLTDSDLYCIEVQKEYYELSATNKNTFEYLVDRPAPPFSGLTGTEIVKINTSNYDGNIKDLRIIGAMKSDTNLSFDPAPYFKNIDCDSDQICKRNINKCNMNQCERVLESLISLLSLNGIDCNNSLTKLFLIKTK